MFRSRVSQSTINRKTYIPPHIQQAINQHLQNTMPGNMKQYTGGGNLVPGHAQKQISKQLDNMPGHLKQYAGAYMEQNILSSSRVSPPSSTPIAPHPPVPDRLRLDHSNVNAAQFDAKLGQDWFAPDVKPEQSSTNPSPDVNESVPQSVTITAPQSEFDFITNPAAPSKKNFLSTASMKQRIIIVLGGVIVLIVLVAVVSSVLNRSPSTAGLITLAQNQNEMITFGTSADSQASQQVTKNLAINIQLALTTSQQQLLTYIGTTGKKVSTSQLAAGTPASITKELAAAQAASNFDAVYIQVTQKELTNYVQNLKQNFTSNSSPTAKQMLSTQYKAANLLLTEANDASSALQNS